MRVLRHDPGVPAVRDRQTGKPNTGKPDRVPDRMHDMAQFPRFEDALPAWRVQARLVPQAGRGAAPPGSRPHDPIASACLTWLAGHGCWPNQAADMRRVEAEVQAAIHQLVEPLPEQEPAWEIRSSAWAVPAAAGAAIGAMIVDGDIRHPASLALPPFSGCDWRLPSYRTGMAGSEIVKPPARFSNDSRRTDPSDRAP